MKKFAVVLAAAAIIAGPASAADLIVDAPIVDEFVVNDWSGFYAGVVGGWAAGEGSATNTVSGVVGTTAASGALLGLNAGFNHQMDSFVLGAEGEILWSGVRGTEPCDNFAATCTADLQWLGSVRGRAGVAVDSFLLYGTLGVAFGGLSTSFTPAVAPVTGTFSGTAFGWTAGLGAEVQVAENVSLKAEYAYYALGPVRAPVNALSTDEVDVRGSAHTGKVGVNFKF